jgi:hypothetical protein
MTLDEFFEGYKQSRPLFEKLCEMVKSIGIFDLRVTKSQVAFRRKKAFAWAWVPGRYLHGNTAPLVLTLAFAEQDISPRWKQIVEPAPGKFTHHLELHSPIDLDEQVMEWLRRAWLEAG